jgi:hypothetical protein
MPKGVRKCAHCKVFFRPVASAKHRQRYCSSAVCQGARKAAANARFLAANPDYFRGPHQVARVRAWRAANPGYGRKKGAAGVKAPALQVVSASEVLASEVDTLRDVVVALQAVCDQQGVVLEGLASHLTGVALQAELGVVLGGWYDLGRRLRGPSPGDRVLCHPTSKESGDESGAVALSDASASGAQVVQLGRSPPGA